MSLCLHFDFLQLTSALSWLVSIFTVVCICLDSVFLVSRFLKWIHCAKFNILLVASGMHAHEYMINIDHHFTITDKSA
jgi:hypothetical protein